MEAVLDALTNAQNAEELALLATALFTVVFQWCKKLVPENWMLPVSFVVGAAIGLLGAYLGDTTEAAGWIVAALINAGLPTAYFKAGQYVGIFKQAKGAPSA